MYSDENPLVMGALKRAIWCFCVFFIPIQAICSETKSLDVKLLSVESFWVRSKQEYIAITRLDEKDATELLKRLKSGIDTKTKHRAGLLLTINCIKGHMPLPEHQTLHQYLCGDGKFDAVLRQVAKSFDDSYLLIYTRQEDVTFAVAYLSDYRRFIKSLKNQTGGSLFSESDIEYLDEIRLFLQEIPPS